MPNFYRPPRLANPINIITQKGKIVIIYFLLIRIDALIKLEYKVKIITFRSPFTNAKMDMIATMNINGLVITKGLPSTYCCIYKIKLLHKNYKNEKRNTKL